MRNLFKTIGIIALVAVMGTMVACSKGGGSGKAPKESPASDFVYDTDGAGGIIITKYIGKGGNVVIPSTIEGLPVTQLGFEAFRGGTHNETGEKGPGLGITSIVIPESVWLIRNRCFELNTTLQSVIFMKSDNTSIDWSTLMTSKHLQIGQGTDMPGTLRNFTINGVFNGCTNLKSITFMGSPTIISNYAFKVRNILYFLDPFFIPILPILHRILLYPLRRSRIIIEDFLGDISL